MCLLKNSIFIYKSALATDYIEYMMGHKVSTYHDVLMLGIKKLRQIYSVFDRRALTYG